ncbi:hypothetical protein RRG08_026822 [Elysia crispata]|uniref:Uncharacterized protein n=1 Tax=Elysia crispata TaxID=231223 RepID=A0AAE0ZH96_9GAST|nr:hypothetical protein RRG08_026822 [Elysia crispata]
MLKIQFAPTSQNERDSLPGEDGFNDDSINTPRPGWRDGCTGGSWSADHVNSAADQILLLDTRVVSCSRESVASLFRLPDIIIGRELITPGRVSVPGIELVNVRDVRLSTRRKSNNPGPVVCHPENPRMKCRVVSANLSRRNFSGESYIEVVLYARWDANRVEGPRTLVREITLVEHPLIKVNGLESRMADREAQQQHSSNSWSWAGTDRIGLPFRRTLPATPRGGSWYLGTPWTPYQPTRLAPGEVTPASM